MDKLDNLLKQQELIQEQISDVKTAGIKAQIEALKTQEQEFLRKIRDAKSANKLADVEISKRIAELKKEIADLNNISISRIYSKVGLENSLRAVQSELSRKQFELNNLLSEL